ncbi:MAG TPA: hypothetical protein VF418_15575 [Sphingomonadaceae bacterium]
MPPELELELLPDELELDELDEEDDDELDEDDPPEELVVVLVMPPVEVLVEPPLVEVEPPLVLEEPPLVDVELPPELLPPVEVLVEPPLVVVVEVTTIPPPELLPPKNPPKNPPPKPPPQPPEPPMIVTPPPLEPDIGGSGGSGCAIGNGTSAICCWQHGVCSSSTTRRMRLTVRGLAITRLISLVWTGRSVLTDFTVL